MKSMIDQIRIVRVEASFDRACDEAYKQAAVRFFDEAGRPKDLKFKSAVLQLEFQRYEVLGSMTGREHTYIFTAYIED